MRLDRIAERLAAQKGMTSKQTKRLLEAEARLLKEYFKPLKSMSNEEIIVDRYTKSAASNELAAVEMIPLIMSVYTNESAPMPLVLAANEYMEAADGIDISGFEGAFDLSRVEKHKDEIRQELTNILAHKEEFRGDWSEIEAAARKTYGLRKSRADVEAKFQELLKKGFDAQEFSNYVESIQAELDNFMYDDGYEDTYEVIND